MTNKKDKDNDKDIWRTPSKRLVTFETIENNNLNIHSDPSIKCNMEQHSQKQHRMARQLIFE